MIRALAALAAVLGLAAAWWQFTDRALASDAGPVEDQPEFPLSLSGALPEQSTSRDLYECWLGDEIVLARAPALGRDSLPRFAEEPGVPKFANIELADGRRARAVAVRYLRPRPERPDPLRSSLVPDLRAPVSSPGAHPVEVIVAQPEEELESVLRQLRLLIAVSWIVTSLLSAAGLTWVVRRGLAPLEDLGDQIQSKDESELDQPFSLPGASVELAPVVDRLNGFRERVGSAIEREHDFAAHAAHELRTPLAGLRSTLEVSLSRERDPLEYRESEHTALKITTQLERLVGRLLELARTASPSAVVRPERFELRQLALESWTPFSDSSAERGVLLEIAIDPELWITSDRQLLGRVLQNLLENLGNYADEGSLARLTAVRTGDDVVMVVENACAGLDEELVRHAFDAFWRSDDARSAVGRHAGLGLALCRQLVELLSGTISASGDAGRFRVTVVLPRDAFTTKSLAAGERPQGSSENDPSDPSAR
ncbi:MAG: ATP-binding protein [Planctomycetota bacterium]|nr:ATP-binding protein [Planctomycetota bacterium]